MSIFGISDLIPEDYLLTVINSSFISLYVDNFVNNIQTFQINDARQLPFIIPNEQEKKLAHSFVTKALKAKKEQTGVEKE